MMEVVSVNVSPGREVVWRDEVVETGIFKEAVGGPVRIHRLGLEGDRQVDERVHGGPHKAVYAYTLASYAWWQDELGRSLSPGMFGENLTIGDMDEGDVCVGDRFAVGAAVLEAAEPRLPCFKLGIRFDDPRMPKRFMQARRFGIYFRVIEGGAVAAGDAVRCIHRDPHRLAVARLARLRDWAGDEPDAILQALEVSALSPDWAAKLRASLG